MRRGFGDGKRRGRWCNYYLKNNNYKKIKKSSAVYLKEIFINANKMACNLIISEILNAGKYDKHYKKENSCWGSVDAL